MGGITTGSYGIGNISFQPINRLIMERMKAAIAIPRVTHARNSLNLKRFRSFVSASRAIFPRYVMTSGVLREIELLSSTDSSIA